MIFSELIKDVKSVPQTVEYKLRKGLATLKDQDEVLGLNNPYWAYKFAKYVPGADIKRCQRAACKNSEIAYKFAKYVPGANIEKCQEATLKDPQWAYWFAKDVPGANKKYCRELSKKRIMNE